MIHHTKTKYILELDAKEYATFIAAIYILNREKLEKYYRNNLDENIYGILIEGKNNIYNNLENIYNKKDFIVSSDIIQNILKGEEL